MTPVLGIMKLAVHEVASNFRKLFRDFIIDKFAQSELAMVQFAQRQMLFVCFALFLVIFGHRQLAFLSTE